MYLLPFDHRHSYIAGMFHLTATLTAQRPRAVAESKRAIDDGFREAVGRDVPLRRAGVLVDEDFGAEILLDATANGHVTALPVEKSGSAELEFEYGEAFAQYIESFLADVREGPPALKRSFIALTQLRRITICGCDPS